MTAPESGQGRSALPGGTKGPTTDVAYIGRMIDLEREYSPSSRVGGDAGPFVADYLVRSVAAAEALKGRASVVRGGSYVASDDGSNPLLVFIHGGYWQMLNAASSLYLAPGALAQGWSFASIECTLAPKATITEMVRECRAALASIATVVSPSQVVIAGHSAGAHLAAMATLASTPPFAIERTVLISGVYDLRPLVHTTINAPLGLDEESAAAVSPQLLPVAGRQEVIVTWGDNETDAFKQQSRDYAAHVGEAGLRVESFETAGRHHFDIVDDLVDPSTELGRRALGLS